MGAKSADTPRFDVAQFVSDNCVAICMLLAIVALSFTGVGNAMFVCALGAMLCVAILTKRSMKLDLWIFIPLVIYIVIGAIATFVTYGTLTEGYVCVEAVFLAIYLAIASMGDEEAFLMRRGCVAWAIVAGAVAIVLFACNAFGGVVSRLNWPLSGANAEGIFLVIAWFALRALKSDETPDRVLRLGPLLAVVAACIRGSAPATFVERLEMMGNGFGYLSVNPLFGIGPYQWRMLNMADGDTYFNTWHIHNSLLHISVELGLIAALMLLVIVVRFFLKRRNPEQRGGFIAFFVHNMFDTSFFFPAITGLMMVTAGSPRETGACLCGAPVKILAGAFALGFAALALCYALGI